MKIVIGTRHWLGADWTHVDADRAHLTCSSDGCSTEIHPVDIVCDARNVPLATGSADHVFSTECLEHFEWRDVPIVVKEWCRLVRQGGTIRIETPDFLAACQQVLETDTLEMDLAIQQIVFAEQTGPWDYHKTGLTHRTLPHFIDQAGLDVTNVQRGWECGWLRVDARRS